MRRIVRAVLLIFQAMDAAGKDGAFKAPSSEDLAHDYLWRCRGTPRVFIRLAASSGTVGRSGTVDSATMFAACSAVRKIR
jgi:hypothetical protein